jgi:ppGpp synthetase/RelA/SpoT-type nucleotidyltranferase
MSRVNPTTSFLAAYEDQEMLWDERSVALRDFVQRRLDDRSYDVAQVTARAKSANSLMTKLLFKQYEDPATQLTDLVGARVITFYGEQVDHIVARLRGGMTVDKGKSLDKRQVLLGDEQFGYRSVHLVGRVNRASMKAGDYAVLRGVVFEVQVRSVLDHAWAEIEHELVYKAGVDYSPETKRRFAALAGAFEILELEFVRLRAESSHLVDAYRASYAGRREGGSTLDGARLIAILEVLQPDGIGWRHRESIGQSPDVEVRRCLKALRETDLDTAAKVRQTYASKAFHARLETYASLRGLATAEVSHFAVAVLLVGTRSRDRAIQFFPELVKTEAIAEALGVS